MSNINDLIKFLFFKGSPELSDEYSYLRRAVLWLLDWPIQNNVFLNLLSTPQIYIHTFPFFYCVFRELAEKSVVNRRSAPFCILTALSNLDAGLWLQSLTGLFIGQVKIC